MSTTRNSLRLTLEGAQTLIDAAVAAAKQMQVPQCIAVVDDACNLLAFARMDGSRVLSVLSAQRKAKTAATTGKPTGELPADVEIKLAVATDGEMVNLKGGLPVIVDGQVIGGIGIGSGTGDQDREIANAALMALPGAKIFAFG
ncbi:MAG TPA: heme-binding protein [Pseudolabrys sp.]|nr:heme-binding protein [Pseudolabrys sp.]